MTISRYIEQSERLKHLDFITCYAVIVELLKDGYVIMADGELQKNVV